eukprot:TRINITY_DN71742_c0_g1_i1.p1 TRINITY_DN71742_c0_g1~~TRINITY_DN71742_c0_g1_i1.p1  ORF type:complete len:505 (+),score=75.46 TRINITY_DN71742_c0_g1_i1:68-1582(+)
MGFGAISGLQNACETASPEELAQLASQLSDVDRARLLAAVSDSDRDVCVKLDEAIGDPASITLSPFDIISMGRAVPMVWFFRQKLSPDSLLASLRKTLVHFPVLCGRYDGESPPKRILLNNSGVPVRVRHLDGDIQTAVAHLPAAAYTGEKAEFDPDVSKTCFDKDLCQKYFHASSKELMDPDQGRSDAPLLALQISVLKEGGTVIGVLLQHAVCDADAIMAFMRAWSQVHRGRALASQPSHDRDVVCKLPMENTVAADADGKPTTLRVEVVKVGEPRPPAFMAVMPKIAGSHVAVVPFSKQLLKQLKDEASAQLPEGKFVSQDDVITAKVWRAMAATRCHQLGLSGEEVTTCARAVNFRKRTNPPLGPGYFANGVHGVRTECICKDLINTLPLAEVALRLRADLSACGPEQVPARALWLRQRHSEGCTTPPVFDKHALTFLISSWMFDWEGVDFAGPPVAYDHCAFVPFVAVFTPRAGGDGINVYVSGTDEAIQYYCKHLVKN